MARDADPRARAVVGRLPRAARRGADRRAAPARARRRAGREPLERLRRASGSTTASGGWSAAIRRLPAGTVVRDGRARPVPGRARRGARRASSVTVDPDAARDRGRPARQPRLPAVRPQPHRGDRADRGDDRRLQRPRHRRAAERRQLPAAPRAPARELRRRDPAAPGELLGGDDEPRRADRELVARALGELGEGIRHRRGRPRAARRRWRSSPASTRATTAARSSTSCSSPSPAAPGAPAGRRLADDPRHRSGRASSSATASRSTS